MTKQKNIIIDSIGYCLVSNGYKKKSSSWYKSNSETIFVVDVQKSTWGNQYYINCGVSLKSLSSIELPKEIMCHIRFRVPISTSKTDKQKFSLLLDLEYKEITDDERKKCISEELNYTISTLDKDFSSELKISSLLKKEKNLELFIHKKVKERFE